MKYGRLLICLGTSAVIVGLIALSFINFFYRSDIITGTVIAEETKRLAGIFNAIHKQCKILSFDNQQNIINFLNVESFTGSEVGPMNLGHPDKWQGPYVVENPTVQAKEFMVVRSGDDYFVTPGNEVRLPNGKVIGKDIVLDKTANISAMTVKGGPLYFQGRPLAQKITLS